MNSFSNETPPKAFARHAILLLLLTITAGLLPFCRVEAASQIVLWDTISPLAENSDASGKANWKAVPTDLFALETNPAKASSDPGYYGREFVFKGDAVVENASLTAVFPSAKGNMVLYAKGLDSGGSSGKMSFGRKIAEISPLQSKTARISHFGVIRNGGDEVVLEVSFANDSTEASAMFSFGKNEIVEIKPSEKLKGIHLRAPIEYGVVPSFIGDDLIAGVMDHAPSESICLPSENLFMGLLKGESTMLVMTWPKANQQLRLKLAAEPEGKRHIESVDFENDGQSVYLAPLSAPGIWHKEDLNASYLEKDVSSKWKRPFPAKWETELSEAGVKTRFAFREAKGEIWRGVPGSYEYPVWFEGDNAFYHFSKKVPPKGESLVYFLEGENTPVSISTPVDVLKATLGRQAAENILDAPGRKLRTHHRRGASGVRRACTCGCTEAIQAIFEEGQEVAKKSDINEELADMTYFVAHHVERINEYQRAADGMIQFLDETAKTSPDLKPFVESLEQIVRQIPEEYRVQRENMKSPQYAGELVRKTLGLTEHQDQQNLAAYMDLLKDWRAMGGAQDYVLAQCHAITRKLFQEAGSGCAPQSKAVKLAEAVRQRCREVLRNPDGYEIWPNY